MISDPSSVIYACVSKKTTILAEFTTGDPDLDALALKCLENAPRFHSLFSHNARRRSYRFLMDDPFIYFGIFDESFEKARGLWLLDRIKDAFEGFLESKAIRSFDNLASYCFQGDLNPIFRELLAPRLRSSNLPKPMMKDSRNASMESSKGHKIVSVPLLGNPGKGLKKKNRKRMMEEENNLECNKVGDASIGSECVLTREYSVFFEKNEFLARDGGGGGGLFAADGGRERAKQKWIQHVCVVLGVDLIVCCVLFGIWLGICRGFKCMDG